MRARAAQANSEAFPAVTTGETFNDPTGDAAAQNAVLYHLGDLIKGAPPGSMIQLSMYQFESNWIRTVLIDAAQRGVTVQVILDHRSIETDAGRTAVQPLRDALGTDGGNYGDSASWVLVCPEHEACLAADSDLDDSYYPVNHNKFFLFSSTSGAAQDPSRAASDVVVQSSANLTTWDRVTAWNDALTVAGNSGLYDAYGDYFDDLRDAGLGRIPHTSDYRVQVQAGPAKVYYFPRTGTNADVIVNILDTVDDPIGDHAVCHGNSAGYGTTDGRTVIRIAMHQITRPAVAEKLWKLDNAGCYVDVVYAKLDENGSTVADWLTKPDAYGGIALHQLAGASVVHSKYLLVEGGYNGTADRKLVFTGSHTYTYSALCQNDEALLKYDDPQVYDAYRSDFWRLHGQADSSSAWPVPVNANPLGVQMRPRIGVTTVLLAIVVLALTVLSPGRPADAVSAVTPRTQPSTAVTATVSEDTYVTQLDSDGTRVPIRSRWPARRPAAAVPTPSGGCW